MYMSIQRIQIHQTSGAIQIESRRAELLVSQSRQLQMNIRQMRAQMNIERRLPRVQIDQTQSFASAGLRTALVMASDFYRRSLSAGLESISSIVQEGLRFLRIEQGGNPIREAAIGRERRPRQFAAAAMPNERPSVTVDPGSVDITWTPHSVETTWEWVEGQAEYVPYEIYITMNPYPSIEITLEDGVELDFPVSSGVGEYVDETT